MRSIVNFDPRVSLLIVAIGSLFLALLPVQVGAETSWDWESSAPALIEKTEIRNIPNDECHYDIITIKIAHSGELKTGCVATNGYMRIGSYWSGRQYTNVISIGLDTDYYNLYGMCDLPHSCIYLQKSDTLIANWYSPGGNGGIVEYKDVTNRIRKELNTNNQKTYTFDNSNPENKILTADGFTPPVGAIGSSSNERYIAFEIINHGYGILDRKDGSVRRVTAESALYGYGRNPKANLTVSSDGKYLFITGLNNGMRLLNITPTCGDWPTQIDILQNSLISQSCKEIPFFINYYIQNIMDGYRPRFNYDNGVLSFFASTYSDKNFFVKIKASNYTNPEVSYIAIGDSFSSGEGDTNKLSYLPYTNTATEQCHTSIRSYPFLLADKMFIDPLKMISVACSGARTVDIYGDQAKYKGQGDRLSNYQSGNIDILKLEALPNNIPGRIHQEDFLRQYQPKIATIGIGGNDIDLVGKLEACIKNLTCEYAESKEEKNYIANEIKSLYIKLVNTYQSLHNASPSTKLYAVGYPKIIKADGLCNIETTVMLDTREREFADESIKYINQIIEAAAKKVGIKYLDIENSFNGYALCDQNPLAMNAIRVGAENYTNDYLNIYLPKIEAESFHPTEFGHNLTANLIESTTGNLLDYQYCPNEEIICPDNSIAPPEPSPYWEYDSAFLNIRRFYMKMLELDAKIISVALPQYTFLPNSLVKIEVHSTKHEIDIFTTDDYGALNITFDLPENLEYGFHTVHAIGQTYSEENIDIYQSFQYAKPQEEILSTTTDTPSIQNSPQAQNTNVDTNSNTAANQISYRKTNNGESILGENTEKTTEQTVQANSIASVPKKNIDNQSQINNLPIIAIIVVVLSSLIFLRYLFFSSKSKNK